MSQSDATGMFINETHTSAAIWQYRVEKMILEGKTQYQTYQIAEVPRFGKSLFLDYNIQTSLMDEYVFHECMSQPAMTLHPNPKRVLVCGGGEGATLREALAHNTVTDAVMVDIDEELVDMVKVHMPEWHQGAFEDPRTTLIHTDARAWIANLGVRRENGAFPPGSADGSAHSQGFDVILSDLPNPHEDGPGQMLFTKEYFEICRDALTEDGVFAMQAGSANENYPACMACCIKTLREVFPFVAGYYGIVSTFFQPWGFVLASKTLDPMALTAQEIDKRHSERGVKNRYYTGRFHHACFTLPEYLLRAEDDARVLTDAEPFVWDA
jgi:spermidine synthase